MGNINDQLGNFIGRQRQEGYFIELYAIRLTYKGNRAEYDRSCTAFRIAIQLRCLGNTAIVVAFLGGKVRLDAVEIGDCIRRGDRNAAVGPMRMGFIVCPSCPCLCLQIPIRQAVIAVAIFKELFLILV